MEVTCVEMIQYVSFLGGKDSEVIVLRETLLMAREVGGKRRGEGEELWLRKRK